MRYAVAITLIFLGSTTMAQEIRTLTFTEAINIALENNITLGQESNRLEVFQADKSTTYARMAPNVAMSGNLGRNDGNSFNQQEGQVVNGQLDFVNGSLDLNMNLFNGLNRIRSAQSASSALEGQAHLVARTRQQVIRDVANQYLRCLLDNQLLIIAEGNLVNQQEQFRQMDEMVIAGSRAEVDLINQRYQLKNAELQVLQAEIALRNSKASLAQLLLLDPVDIFDVAEPTWELSQFAYEDYSQDSLYDIAMVNRRDLLQARSFEESSRYALSAQRGRYYPQLTAFFSYGSAYNQIVGTPDSIARSFDQQFFEDNVYKTYGLALSIPVFQGLGTRNQVVRAKVDYQNAQLQPRQVQNTSRVEVLNAYQNLRDAMPNYEVALAQEEAAQLNFELQTERYNLQATDFVQYTQANTDYVSAQGSLAQAKFILLFQDILLKFALGTLDESDIPN